MASLAMLALLIAYLIWRDIHAQDERRDFIDLIEQQSQRIQAPQAAVMAHEFKSLPSSPPPLEYDNDEDFHSSREDLVAALKRDNELLM